MNYGVEVEKQNGLVRHSGNANHSEYNSECFRSAYRI